MFIENRTTTGPTSLSETIKHINGERDKYRERVPTGIKNRRQLRLVTARVVKCWCSVWWRGERGGCTPAVLTGSLLASRSPRQQIDLYQSIYQSLISIFFLSDGMLCVPAKSSWPDDHENLKANVYMIKKEREREGETWDILPYTRSYYLSKSNHKKKQHKWRMFWNIRKRENLQPLS